MVDFKEILGIGIKITPYTIKSKRLPKSFSGFKIVHISDLHSEIRKDAFSTIAKLKPDIIVMTGDMTDDKRPYEPFLKLLKSLIKIAPCYIVSGNHDIKRDDREEYVQECRKAGALFLIDESSDIIVGDERIVIHGIDDPAGKTDAIVERNTDESLKKIKRIDGYEILLFHRANKLYLLENEGFNLILSGHMHGGQIRLPYLGGVLGPKSSFKSKDRSIFPKYTAGYYRVGESDAIVNCGLGNPVKLPRFGNPTEIGIITLECE